MATTLNTECIITLANHLENFPDQFDMERWLGHATDSTNLDEWETDDCDTIGCIAGLAVMLFADRGTLDNPTDFPTNIAAEAQHLLGLDDDQAYHLFTPSHGSDIRDGIHCKYLDVTAFDAANTMRTLAETEKVYWQCAADMNNHDF